MPSPSRAIRPAAIPVPSGTPYERATIAPVSSTHPTPSPMPNAVVRSSVREGTSRKTSVSRMYIRNNSGRPSDATDDQCRGHSQCRERDQREQHDDQRQLERPAGPRAAAEETANWPTMVARGAHRDAATYARSRNQDGPFPRRSVRKSPQSPQNSPAGTSVWQTRHSMVAGASWSGGAHAVTFCRMRMLRTRLSMSGVPRPGHQVVARARRRRPRCRRASTSRKPGSREPSATL